jgi:hypothetical protein
VFGFIHIDWHPTATATAFLQGMVWAPCWLFLLRYSGELMGFGVSGLT